MSLSVHISMETVICFLLDDTASNMNCVFFSSELCNNKGAVNNHKLHHLFKCCLDQTCTDL